VIIRAIKGPLVAGFGANVSCIDFTTDIDYMLLADGAQTGLDLLGGDFTLEGWIYSFGLGSPAGGARFVPMIKNGLTGAWTNNRQWGVQVGYTTTPPHNYYVSAHCSEDGAADDTVTWGQATGAGEIFPVNDWMHFALTCDISEAVADQFTLYLDGVDQGASLVSGNAGATAIFDGAAGVCVGGYNYDPAIVGFLGRFRGDEFRVWNYARTLSQINDNMSKRIDPTSPGLICYPRMDDNAGTTATDSTSNGNDFPFFGSPSWVTSPLPF